MYSFIAENDYKFRNCSFNLIKVHTFKQSCSWHRCQRTPNRTGGFQSTSCIGPAGKMMNA